jgi:hypothetical protein
MEHTWLLYGGFSYPDDSQSSSYAFDLAWPLTLFALFLLSAVLLLYQIARRYSGQGDDTQLVSAARQYPFASVVFASLDFHLTSCEVRGLWDTPAAVDASVWFV